MIAAPPPACHQEMTAEDDRMRPRAVGENSRLVDYSENTAARHVRSTPGQSCLDDDVAEADDNFEYVTPPPQKVTMKKVRFRYIGPGKPMPLDDEELDGR